MTTLDDYCSMKLHAFPRRNRAPFLKRKMFYMVVGLMGSPVIEYFKHNTCHPPTYPLLLKDRDGETENEAIKKISNHLSFWDCVTTGGPALVNKKFRKTVLNHVPPGALKVAVYVPETKDAWRARFDEYVKGGLDPVDLNRHFGSYVPPTVEEGFDIVLPSVQRALALPFILEK